MKQKGELVLRDRQLLKIDKALQFDKPFFW